MPAYEDEGLSKDYAANSHMEVLQKDMLSLAGSRLVLHSDSDMRDGKFNHGFFEMLVRNDVFSTAAGNTKMSCSLIGTSNKFPGHDANNGLGFCKHNGCPVAFVSVSSQSKRCRSDINMLTVPKQQPHRRELPIVFKGNKPDQQNGSMTTFKNWAAE
eukprot:3274248-Amphidinium_carterae.1